MKKFVLILVVLFVFPVSIFKIEAATPTATPPATTSNSIPCPLSADLCDFGTLMQSATTKIAPIAALALLIMLVYAGFTKMTAAGDPEKEKKAMQIIQASIIGFSIIALATIIVATLGGFFSLPTLPFT